MHISRILRYFIFIALFTIFITTASLAEVQQPSLNSSQSFIIKLNDSGLNATIGKYPFFVLDFYHPECEPCISLSSTIYQLSNELKGQVVFGTADVRNASNATRSFGIVSLPTLLVFRNGTLVYKEIGYGSKSALVGMLKSLDPNLDVSHVPITLPQTTVTSSQTGNAPIGKDATGSSPTSTMPLMALGTNKPLLPMPVNDSTVEFAMSKYPFFVLMGFADWCGYCRMMNSTIQDLARELKGQVAFGLIDAERNNKTANKYSITAYPRLMIFKNGSLVRIVEGYRDTSSFVGVLKDIEPGLDISQVNAAIRAQPAIASSNGGVTKVINATISEEDPSLKYLEKILTAAQINRTSGVTINIFIINTCPKTT